MRSTCVIAVALALTAPTSAAEEMNSLSPKEIADGWILLFDGQTTFGWRSGDDREWTVEGGELKTPKGKEAVLVTSASFGDFDLRFQVNTPKGADAQVWIGMDPNKKLDRPREEGRREVLHRYTRGWVNILVKVRKGVIVEFDRTAVRGDYGYGYQAAPFGLIGNFPKVGSIVLAGSGFSVRNFKLRPMGSQSLFNGKDLTGWKIHPGRKSKFSVTDEGELRIQDGPGDLQTKKQFDNFALHLECKTNGKHLNSGVFFRCIPDQYQQGYESQIQNGFTEKPEKEYTLSIFDPTTHELKEKKKVKSRAMDYGTGAIYRRMIARKQAAKDKEWFSMTVVANGRHIATWVNGQQVVDWTDNRPANENARRGYRAKAGAISFQGHDPTTDLFFRNIRIQDLTP